MRTFLVLVVAGLLAAQPAFAAPGGGGGGGKGGGGGSFGGSGGWGGRGGYGGYGGYYGGYRGYGWGLGYPGWGGWGGYYGSDQVTTGYWPQTTANPVPQAPAEVVNPATSGVTLSFNVNAQTYSLAPGMKQDLTISPGDTVSFDRGGNLGTATYSLNPAIYTFAATNNGWELYQTALTPPGGQQPATAGANAIPGNPPTFGR
jgi:hypothetical protein